MIHPMLPREPAALRLPVFDDGKCQYVLDDDGEPIYGVGF
jgi:hypothetical protein